jgi:hypothetical protein
MPTYEKRDTGVVWTLYQYVSPMGRKSIEDWRDGLSARRRTDLDVFLRQMIKRRKWERPDIGAFVGKNLKSFRELRWRSENVPHRIGGYFSADDEFVMLLGFTHNARKHDPTEALDLLPRRKRRIQSGEATICEFTVVNSA